MTLKARVGHMYRRRDGSIVLMRSKFISPIYRKTKYRYLVIWRGTYYDETDPVYADGKVRYDGSEHYLDLVKEIKP